MSNIVDGTDEDYFDDGTDEDYFDLLKVKEVEIEEKGVQVLQKELIMMLNCKVRAANYSIFEIEERGVQVLQKELIMMLNCKVRAANNSVYHELKNRVERRLRLSVYIFDEEGCVYPDKSAKKTPLDINKLRVVFKPNPNIRDPILIDNKGERKREETRLHKKPRYKGGFPKEIKMGQVLMPPYYWHRVGEDSTLDPRQSELVEKRADRRTTTPRQIIIEVQLMTDPKHHGLAQNKSHADINALMLINQDKRSILISDQETSQGIGPIDDNFYKRKKRFRTIRQIHNIFQQDVRGYNKEQPTVSKQHWTSEQQATQTRLKQHAGRGK